MEETGEKTNTEDLIRAHDMFKHQVNELKHEKEDLNREVTELKYTVSNLRKQLYEFDQVVSNQDSDTSYETGSRKARKND